MGPTIRRQTGEHSQKLQVINTRDRWKFLKTGLNIVEQQVTTDIMYLAKQFCPYGFKPQFFKEYIFP